MSKPTVRYHCAVDATPSVGRRVRVYLVDPHPVLGVVKAPMWVHTSEIVHTYRNGDFETLNTLYNKVDAGERA